MSKSRKTHGSETEVRSQVGPYVAEHSWQLQTAKAKFSEVFRLVRTEGPQHITRQGKDGVVIISEEEYVYLASRSKQSTGLIQFFQESPLAEIELNLERDRDPGRDIEL